MKLTIELVPSTSWYDNVRSQVDDKTWDTLRRDCYRKAKFKCEICSETGLEQGFKWPVECHEIWNYDDKNHVQRLDGLIALCPLCHKVKHAGRTGTVDGIVIVMEKLMKVNGWSPEKTYAYIDQAFKTWKIRSKYKWTVDINILNKLIPSSNIQVL
jgi:hypothetical protein